jgi:hypothetical protein
MDDFSNFLSSNFDWYFVIMILLGNYFIFNLISYPEIITNLKRSKVYLTLFHSVIIGVIYFYIDKTINMKILINSFLLSTSIYEMGLKEILDYVKQNGSNIVLSKLKSKVESDTNISQG